MVVLSKARHMLTAADRDHFVYLKFNLNWNSTE